MRTLTKKGALALIMAAVAKVEARRAVVAQFTPYLTRTAK